MMCNGSTFAIQPRIAMQKAGVRYSTSSILIGDVDRDFVACRRIYPWSQLIRNG